MDSRRSVWPDVIVPGLMKSGTTSVHRWLTVRPDVAAGHKEPEFFADDGRWNKGLDWYGRQLSAESTGLTVDASPTYADPAVSSLAAERAAATNPAARIVVVVRDPIERAIAHFDHEIQRGRDRRDPADLAGALTPDSAYVRLSRYHTAVVPWFECFPAASVLVVATPQLDGIGWRAILDHLGLPYGAHPTERSNRSEGKPRFNPLMARLYRARSLRRFESHVPRQARRALRPLLFRPGANGPAFLRNDPPRETVDLLAHERTTFEHAIAERGVRYVH